MTISILLPYKENYSPQYAGAVSLFVKDITKVSSYKKNILIFGNTDSNKKLSKNYVNLNLNKKIFQSTSKIYVETFLKYQKKINSNLIEVHNRPNYIKQIKKNFSRKLILYFHNDPLSMSGSKKKSERIYLLNNIDKRLAKHNSNKGAKSTKGYKWLLIYDKKFKSKKEAMSFEYKLKNNRILRREILEKSNK